jgi:fibronectin-binding autotransporter adhesin
MQQIHRRSSMVVLLIITWAGIQPASGQYTSNFQTNTVSGVTSNWSGDYVVGSNTFANALLIRNGGMLSNADGYVGYLPASNTNFVMVAGAGSAWTNAFMYFGYSGGGNTMVISNGGSVVEAGQGTYVAYNTTSSSNRVLVTGTNSLWNCAGHFFMGNSGSGNSLVVSNAGQVVNGVSYVGETSTSSNNRVLVTGANSLWNNSACLIGDNGSDNSLIINKGGRVVCNAAQLGYFGSASGNSAWISDTNSVWDVSATAAILSVGLTGPGNSVVVTNGGTILGYYVYLGNYASSGNSMLVTGRGSILSGNCYVFTGNQGNNNTFTVARGGAVSDKFCYISYVAGSSNNTVLITDPNSSWQNSFSTFVGFDGVAGNLIISNGATMTVAQEGVLGQDSTSSNNNALITGAGSTWNNADNTYVGHDGGANNLVISNGGWVIDLSGAVGFSSDSNSVMVAGAGSVWTNYNEVYVGYFGSDNSLVISNGGQVLDYDGYLGYTNGFNNQALVAGAGSVWSNNDATLIGDFGSSNSLVIGGGGLVVDYWGLVGEDASGSNNTVLVEPGGVWRNQQLAVGDLGSQNALYVEGGSVLVNTSMEVGYNSLYCNNLVQEDSGQMIVTNQTGSAVLEVYDGSFVLNGGTLRVDTLIVTNDCAQFRHVGGTLIYKTLQLNPNQSAVGDGIPNWWKQQYGFDPLDPTVAGADPDHDGMSNLQEYLAGTNPTNAASRLAITSLVLTNGNVRVNWSAVGGRSYVVQTNSMPGNSFADASPVITVPGTNGTVTNYLDPGVATNSQAHFYRVRLGP